MKKEEELAGAVRKLAWDDIEILIEGTWRGGNTKACGSRAHAWSWVGLLVLSKVADGEVGYGTAWAVQ